MSVPTLSNASELPDILNSKLKDDRPPNTQMSMRVETRVIDPQTQNDQSIVWQLPRQGLLTGSTTLMYKINGPTGSFLPLTVGALSLISVARMRIGGQTILENRNCGLTYSNNCVWKTDHELARLQSVRTTTVAALQADFGREAGA